MRMERLKMQSLDVTSSNIDKIAQLFPQCVTERKDKNGKTVLGIDFEKLRDELSIDVIDEGEERYQFTWPDKKAHAHLANTPTTKTLRPCREESVDFDNTKNLYIEGDNLEVLKVIRETYLGKVKMIYIDPPYNTGSDFVYNDDFSQSNSEYQEHSGQRDEEGNRMVQNTESNGRFHTDWLNMIYPRLKVAKDLLTDDGVIFISIDDHEVENLRKVCDEIFGEGNFIGQLILKTATDNNPSQINTEHEYMLCYAKAKIKQTNWLRQSEATGLIVQQYNALKREYTEFDIVQKKLRQWIKNNKERLPQVTHYNNVDEKGVYSNSSNSSNPHPGGYMYDIIHPITGLPCPKPANGWRWPEETFRTYNKEGEIDWGKDHTTQPHVKKRIETSVEYLRTLIYEDNRATTKMLSDLFGGRKIFDNPKPLNVLSRIIDYVTNKNSLILDFFSGSATTAHAVMQLNTEDGGNRKFIMVQLPENTGEKSEAYKAGYKNICEIGKERIRRSGRKIIEDLKQKQPDLFTNVKGGVEMPDVGFRVLKLDSSNMRDVYYAPKEFTEQVLFADNVKPDRTAEDLLFQVMLDLGVELSATIEQRTMGGKQVFCVNDNYLIACFDTDITEDTIKAIAKLKPYYFVMSDSSLASDNVADNFNQLFEAYSKDTIRKII